MSAHATAVMVTLPKVRTIPPTPAMSITHTTKRFLLSPRSTCCIIFKPDTAMKPYRVTHTPPITQEGMVARKVANGEMNEITIAMIAVVKMVRTDALPEIATQPTDSP